MNPDVDFFFEKAEQWQAEMLRLRTIVLDCGLEENLKWGVPCYTYGQANVLLIHAFKDYCALLFVKGALLQNSDGLLIQQTAQVQAARQIRFSSLQEVIDQEHQVKNHIFEAIEVEKAGLKVQLKKTEDFEMPEELKQEMDKNPAFKAAWEALTPGRKRGYILHFSAPKQAKTRLARIEKYMPLIFQGKGYQDR